MYSLIFTGEDECEVSGECEAPPTSRPRLSGTPDPAAAPQPVATVNHVNENHQVVGGGESADEAPKVNGISNGYESDSNGGTQDDQVEPMPPIPPIKELSPEELAEKMKLVHRLQVELRNEEMKLVLLKKVRQSQVRPAATASRVDAGGVNVLITVFWVHSEIGARTLHVTRSAWFTWMMLQKGGYFLIQGVPTCLKYCGRSIADHVIEL